MTSFSLMIVTTEQGAIIIKDTHNKHQLSSFNYFCKPRNILIKLNIFLISDN